MSDPLLEIKNLVTGFETESGLLKAVDGVSFTVPKGTCVGIVGESGCGKSVTAMSIVRLLPQPWGKFWTGKFCSRAATCSGKRDGHARHPRPPYRRHFPGTNDGAQSPYTASEGKLGNP